MFKKKIIHWSKEIPYWDNIFVPFFKGIDALNSNFFMFLNFFGYNFLQQPKISWLRIYDYYLVF